MTLGHLQDTPDNPAAPRLLKSQARWALRSALPHGDVERILAAADVMYVPPPDFARTAPGRLNLQMAAYALAVRDALVANGFAPEEARALIRDSLHRIMRRMYRPVDRLARLRHRSNASARVRCREHVSRVFFFRSPDWEFTDVDCSSAFGFDVHRCVLAAYMRQRDASFCEGVLCAQDFLLATDRGETLKRKGTIVGGADRCDFRFSS